MSPPEDLALQVRLLAKRLKEVLGELHDQRGQLSRLALAYGMDAERGDRLRALPEAWDLPAIEAHLRHVVAAAPMISDPFPHLVIEPLLPPEGFKVLVDAVPAEEFFEGEPHLGLKGLGLPQTILPLFSRLVWRSVLDDVLRPVLAPLLARRFQPLVRDFLRIGIGDDLVDDAMALPLIPRGLRLMLRRPGWKLAPHVDPRHQFITTLLYLACPGEPETYGTQLFRVHRKNFMSRRANTYYPEDDGIRCELAQTIPYRGNLCLSFLNLGGGAHGAVLPSDAQPADMRRKVFQFYIGPDRQALEGLVERLPPDRQVAWKLRVKEKDLRAARREAAITSRPLE
jgi:hypothetical protein